MVVADGYVPLATLDALKGRLVAGFAGGGVIILVDLILSKLAKDVFEIHNKNVYTGIKVFAF